MMRCNLKLRNVKFMLTSCRGSAISTIIGKNVLEHGDVFDQQVHMWVREEEHEGRLLDEWVNKTHMNPK